jgi:hypothetical protein
MNMEAGVPQKRQTLAVKPTNEVQYIEWLRETQGVEITDRVRNHYESAVVRMKEEFETSVFWREMVRNLRKYHDEYETLKGYPLLQNFDPPIIEKKPWKSFLDKTLRQNVIWNDRWPKAPIGGWLLPKNWFSKIDDILRTTIVVKYLDGVHFLVNKTRKLCEYSRRSFNCDFEAKEEGYYAVHMYVIERLEIPRIDWDTEIVPVKIEIQITTQIQEVIRKLLHKYYEERRSQIPTITEYGWQWNYESDEFVANYLGHILHYVEGMIMEIRDERREDGKI